MRLVQSVSEQEVVAVFLQTEIHSVRYRDRILALLARDGMEAEIVERPNLTDVDANRYRMQLLGDFRGYRQNWGLFETFPEDVFWQRVVLHKEELTRVRYIDYSYWNELSGGSRLPSKAAQNIRAGVEVYGVPNEGFWRTAEAIRNGISLPELILIGVSPDSLIVLEGHSRLTAYSLVPDKIPDEMTVLMGISPGFASWN